MRLANTKRGSGRSPLAISALILLAHALPSRAQQQAPADTTRADTTRTQYQLAPIEVVGSIAPTAAPQVGSGIPARISTETGEQVDAWEPALLPDALASQPGVSMYDDLGSPFKMNLSTRGFSVGPTVGLPPGVSVFVDGVRQNEPDAQEVNFDLLPLDQVQRVELLNATASLLGPNSLGGAINLITRRGQGPPGGELELSGGSFGAVSGEGSLDGRTGRGLGYYAAGGYDRRDGWRQGTGSRSYRGFVNLDRLEEDRGIRVQAYGAKSRAEEAGSLPESIFRRDPQTNFTTGDFEDLNLEQLAVSGYLPVLGGQTGSTVYFRRSDAERFNVNQAPEPNARSFTTNYTLGGNVDWRRPVDLGGRRLSLRGGLDGTMNRVYVKIHEEPVDGSPPRLTTSARSPSTDVAAYLLGELEVGPATLSAGARFDYVRIPFHDRLDPANDTTSSYKSLSPRGGISVELGEGFSTYGSVGLSFRAPAILELACASPDAACPLPFALGEDPPLDPVRAATYEVGGRWIHGPVSADASLYWTEVRNEIFFVSSERSPVQGYFTNLARTRRQGIELSVRWQPAGEWSLYANYALTRATFQSAAELFSIRASQEVAGSPLAGPNDVRPGDRLPLVPLHQLKVGGQAALPAGFEGGLDARFIGTQWLRGDEGNETRPLSSYFVANVRLGYRFGPWEAEAVVSNVLGSDAAIFGTFNVNGRTGRLERFLTPQAPRSLKVVLRRAFGG